MKSLEGYFSIRVDRPLVDGEAWVFTPDYENTTPFSSSQVVFSAPELGLFSPSPMPSHHQSSLHSRDYSGGTGESGSFIEGSRQPVMSPAVNHLLDNGTYLPTPSSRPSEFGIGALAMGMGRKSYANVIAEVCSN